MKYTKNILKAFITTLLLSIISLNVVQANSAEPPGLTVIVNNAPKELSLSLKTPEQNESRGILVSKQKKGWESYYKFFYSQNLKLTDGVKLIVNSKDKNFECELPSNLYQRYNNIVTLDIESESLTFGQSPFRTVILVVMRVVLTLLIEGVIFYSFGYREKRSWIIFFIVNIVTQGGLNLMLTGPNLSSYWFFGYIFAEVIIILFELLLFTSLLKEQKKSNAAAFVVVANLVSLFLGAIIISGLPV